MCIIILNKQGLVPKTILQNCYINNPDGMGIMYAHKGKIEVFKELKNFELFYEYYFNIRKIFRGNIGLHFRIKTHGKINESNIHPFYVNRDLAFMHNGIIDIDTGKTDLSDTQLFNERILKGLPKNFTRNRAIMQLISESIGYSKLLFLDSSDNYSIINESDGTWKDENWFSNHSYLNESYHWLDTYSECDLCGNALISDFEIEEGFCTECLSKYEQTCKNCNQFISTDDEIQKGYCTDCQNIFAGYLI